MPFVKDLAGFVLTGGVGSDLDSAQKARIGTLSGTADGVHLGLAQPTGNLGIGHGNQIGLGLAGQEAGRGEGDLHFLFALGKRYEIRTRIGVLNLAIQALVEPLRVFGGGRGLATGKANFHAPGVYTKHTEGNLKNRSEVSRETMKVPFAELPIKDIRANPLQPRRRFDQDRLNELADSIRLHGVVQPVVVTREAEGYRLVVGERRWRASRLAGLEKIPALIQEFAPQNLLEVALIENLQRQDLNPVEEARAFQFLLREHKLTQEELAKRLGCSRPAVANAIRLLSLPSQILGDLEAGVLTAGHARAVLPVEGERNQLRAWHEIREKQLSVRATEEFIRKLHEQKPARKGARILAPDWEHIQEQLGQQLNALVKIRPSGKAKGKIELHYRDQAQLEELMDALISVSERRS